MFSEYLKKVIAKKDLVFEEALDAMNNIMTGIVDEVHLSSFLTALKMKGESVDEIAGFASSMINNAEKFEKSGFSIDTCGTGGDGKEMINVSTISAIIAASADILVAKHGNRSISSKCGSADVLEALGIKIDLLPSQSEVQLNKTNFAFLFAPVYHKAMRYAMPVRRKLNIPTVFNILGPISNPAKVDGQIIGVFRRDLVSPIINVLKKIGLKRAMVVHGFDGSDEISIYDNTYIAELKDGEITQYIYEPKRKYTEPVTGSDPAENAKIALSILENKDKGAKREIVLLNAAAAIMISGKAKDMEDGYMIADNILNKKLGIDKIEQIIQFQKLNI